MHNFCECQWTKSNLHIVGEGSHILGQRIVHTLYLIIIIQKYYLWNEYMQLKNEYYLWTLHAHIVRQRALDFGVKVYSLARTFLSGHTHTAWVVLQLCMCLHLILNQSLNFSAFLVDTFLSFMKIKNNTWTQEWETVTNRGWLICGSQSYLGDIIWCPQPTINAFYDLLRK